MLQEAVLRAFLVAALAYFIHAVFEAKLEYSIIIARSSTKTVMKSMQLF
jgi:hypothetical protein